MVGILVHGNNHYILSGPWPTAGEAVALARNWSVVQIGELKSPELNDAVDIRDADSEERPKLLT
jgi:hypothetical protein